MSAPYRIECRSGRCFQRINADGDASARVEAARAAEDMAANLGSVVSVFNHLGHLIEQVRPGEDCRPLGVCEIEFYEALQASEVTE